MKISSFPKVKIATTSSINGDVVVVTNAKNEIKHIIEVELYMSPTPSSYLGFSIYREGEHAYINVEKILEDKNIVFSMIRQAGFSIFYGKIIGGIFESDSATMYKGVLAGNL